MITLTDLEKQVYNAAVEICFEDCSATASELSEFLNLPVNSVKGAIGSLVKKNLLTVENERGFSECNPLIQGKVLSFGWDDYNKEEIDRFKY
ncbi:putative helix-turn-helix domain-containing protein [Vibrio phage 277E43-1]|nr:putative helix-turn-helix domain-containing protein [Vibrio phage 277E43-1]